MDDKLNHSFSRLKAMVEKLGYCKSETTNQYFIKVPKVFDSMNKEPSYKTLGTSMYIVLCPLPLWVG